MPVLFYWVNGVAFERFCHKVKAPHGFTNGASHFIQRAL